MVIVVAVLTIIAAIAIPNFGKLNKVASSTKLQSQVKSLNAAISSYLASGGNLDDLENHNDVLNHLKKSISASDRKAHTGFGGIVIDKRLNVRQGTSGSGQSYAVWNLAKKKFEIKKGNNPEGISEFFLDDSLAGVDYGQETRRTAMEFNRDDGWIWKYSEAQQTVPDGPSNITLASVSIPEVNSAPVPPISLSPTNKNPAALPDSSETEFGLPVAVDVLLNDSDPDGDPLQVAFLHSAPNGNVTQVGNSILYTPNSGFSGDDIFLTQLLIIREDMKPLR